MSLGEPQERGGRVGQLTPHSSAHRSREVSPSGVKMMVPPQLDLSVAHQEDSVSALPGLGQIRAGGQQGYGRQVTPKAVCVTRWRWQLRQGHGRGTPTATTQKEQKETSVCLAPRDALQPQRKLLNNRMARGAGQAVVPAGGGRSATRERHAGMPSRHPLPPSPCWRRRRLCL